MAIRKESVRGRVEALEGVVEYLNGRRSRKSMVVEVREALPGLRSRRDGGGEGGGGSGGGGDDMMSSYEGLYVFDRVYTSLWPAS